MLKIEKSLKTKAQEVSFEPSPLTQAKGGLLWSRREESLCSPLASLFIRHEGRLLIIPHLERVEISARCLLQAYGWRFDSRSLRLYYQFRSSPPSKEKFQICQFSFWTSAYHLEERELIREPACNHNLSSTPCISFQLGSSFSFCCPFRPDQHFSRTFSFRKRGHEFVCSTISLRRFQDLEIIASRATTIFSMFDFRPRFGVRGTFLQRKIHDLYEIF